MVYTGLDVSISPTTPLPLGTVPRHTVRHPCIDQSIESASYSLLAAGVALARLYSLQKGIGCIALGHARYDDGRPNRERA